MTKKVKIVPNSAAEEGNTNSRRPQVNKAKYWCFTWNNYPNSANDILISCFNERNIKYLFGEEIAPTTGTPHLQGFIQSPEKIRPTELKLPIQISWRLCNGNERSNWNYCSKDGIIHTNMEIPKTKEQEADELGLPRRENLRPYQSFILNIINEPIDQRAIYWFWDKKGNKGKTELSRYLTFWNNAVPLEGKKSDILYCAAEFPSNIYIYDLERSLEEYVSYGSIEKIKNGYYMCSKYESKPILRPRPHLFIFANYEPKYSELSLDRWRVFEITDDYNIVKTFPCDEIKPDY